MDARELVLKPPSFFCLCLSRALGPALRPDLCAWQDASVAVESYEGWQGMQEQQW
jgi:hypothetical protein